MDTNSRRRKTKPRSHQRSGVHASAATAESIASWTKQAASTADAIRKNLFHFVVKEVPALEKFELSPDEQSAVLVRVFVSGLGDQRKVTCDVKFFELVTAPAPNTITTSTWTHSGT